MKETIYHGSDHIIEMPEYGLGSLKNDYGRARKEYRQEKQLTSDIGELYMLDIMREGIHNGDPRIR